MSDVHEVTELLLPGPAEALAGLLNVDLPDLDGGEPLPLMWHWLYLLDRPRQADLGTDGHPFRGTVLGPPGPARRRMWAGGQVVSRGPLRVGEPATRRARVLESVEKSGRSGSLTLVTVEHTVTQRGDVVVQERQDVVYRDAATAPPDVSADAPPSVPPSPDEWEVRLSAPLLFRFSALTYNAHRIHYDRDYARDVEGYPGLVVHGPLQALVMSEAARRAGAAVPELACDYRLVSPLFDHQGLVVRAVNKDEAIATTVRDRAGRITARGVIYAV